jgi:hypothetical protein
MYHGLLIAEIWHTFEHQQFALRKNNNRSPFDNYIPKYEVIQGGYPEPRI